MNIRGALPHGLAQQNVYYPDDGCFIRVNGNSVFFLLPSGSLALRRRKHGIVDSQVSQRLLNIGASGLAIHASHQVIQVVLGGEHGVNFVAGNQTDVIKRKNVGGVNHGYL